MSHYRAYKQNNSAFITLLTQILRWGRMNFNSHPDQGAFHMRAYNAFRDWTFKAVGK